MILLLVFGAKRLPEVGRSLGTGMREFKNSISGEPPTKSTTPATADPLTATRSLTNGPITTEPSDLSTVGRSEASHPATSADAASSR